MNILYKKSYCELCKNSSCSDIGKRNIHFMDHNHCSRFDDGLVPEGFVKIPDGSYMEENGNIRLVESFYISKYLVTIEEYRSYYNLPIEGVHNKPVNNISWEKATKYAKSKGCRLPTLNEWEYVCGEEPTNLDDYAWYKENTKELQKVGKKLPNDFGVYDMLGNVWELTSSAFTAFNDYYKAKGGSYVDSAHHCARFLDMRVSITQSIYYLGFRLAKDL